MRPIGRDFGRIEIARARDRVGALETKVADMEIAVVMGVTAVSRTHVGFAPETICGQCRR